MFPCRGSLWPQLCNVVVWRRPVHVAAAHVAARRAIRPAPCGEMARPPASAVIARSAAHVGQVEVREHHDGLTSELVTNSRHRSQQP